MEIGPLSRISIGAPATVDAAQESSWPMRELVAAIGGLNQVEFLPRGHELKLRRGMGKRPAMVDLLDRETGEALDELAPEDVLRMMAELEKEREEEL